MLNSFLIFKLTKDPLNLTIVTTGYAGKEEPCLND